LNKIKSCKNSKYKYPFQTIYWLFNFILLLSIKFFVKIYYSFDTIQPAWSEIGTSDSGALVAWDGVIQPSHFNLACCGMSKLKQGGGVP